jgi:glutamate/tyrosine decarboxylase-like PLP-dependent enzyme
MILQGVNEGEDLGLDYADFFQPRLLEHFDEWVNSKRYTVNQMNRLMGAKSLHELMTDAGRDKHNMNTALFYRALMNNSVLDFMPRSPIYMFHSTQDQTVPFVNAQRAETFFKGYNIDFDFGEYGVHSMGAVRFIMHVASEL